MTRYWVSDDNGFEQYNSLYTALITARRCRVAGTGVGGIYLGYLADGAAWYGISHRIRWIKQADGSYLKEYASEPHTKEILVARLKKEAAKARKYIHERRAILSVELA